MSEPSWLTHARTYLGTAEIPGKQSNPWIRQMWFKLGGEWLWNAMGSDDSASPWCGTFVGAVLRESGLPVAKHWYRAKDWLEWGVKLDGPVPGCVVIYERAGGGHVGFAVAQDKIGRILTLGGNQGNRVSIVPFDRYRLLGCRWPADRFAELTAAGKLPVVKSTGVGSINEA